MSTIPVVKKGGSNAPKVSEAKIYHDGSVSRTRPTNMDDVADHLRDGGNTISKSQSDAEELAWRAGEGRPDLDWKPHGDNQRPHYHPTDKNGNRIGGRSFY